MRNRSISRRSRNRRGLGVARAVVCAALVVDLLWAAVCVMVVSVVWVDW